MEGIKNFKKAITALLVVSFTLGVVGGIAGFIIGQQYSAFDSRSADGVVFGTDNNISGVSGSGDESLTITAVHRIRPAVVAIVVLKEISHISNRTGPNIFPFDDFFDYPFDYDFSIPNSIDEENGTSRKQRIGGGSGFLVSNDGLILTNKHVVDDNDADYLVILNDGSEFEAVVLGVDPFNDLAIIKIEGENFPIVTLGDSNTIMIGQTVIAIGNSLGEFQNTVTKGVVSGVDRRVFASGAGGGEIIEEAIQTDAAINPGNSGGPLINLAGHVIGVNTAISRAGQLIGFAIPINTAKYVVESIIEFGRIVRPWLGVRYVVITSSLASENDLSVDYGAYLLPGNTPADPAIIPGSPAENVGLSAEDIILRVEGERITKEHPLGKLIAKYKPGDTVNLTVLRGTETLAITVTLEEFQ